MILSTSWFKQHGEKTRLVTTTWPVAILWPASPQQLRDNRGERPPLGPVLPAQLVGLLSRQTQSDWPRPGNPILVPVTCPHRLRRPPPTPRPSSRGQCATCRRVRLRRASSWAHRPTVLVLHTDLNIPGLVNCFLHVGKWLQGAAGPVN